MVAGFRSPSFRPPLHPRSTLPPPRRVGPCLHPSLRSDVDLLCPLSALSLATVQAFTTYARRPRSRLGNPARLRWSGGRHRFRQASPAFIHARRTGLVQSFLHDPSASTGPASSVADPDHASSFSPPPDCNKKPPPCLICQSRSRPDRRHSIYRQTPRRRISDNI